MRSGKRKAECNSWTRTSSASRKTAGSVGNGEMLVGGADLLIQWRADGGLMLSLVVKLTLLHCLPEIR